MGWGHMRVHCLFLSRVLHAWLYLDYKGAQLAFRASL
jgi:hypothetical protein